MGNYKIKVNTEAESREVQALAFDLGKTHDDESVDFFSFCRGTYPQFINIEDEFLSASRKGLSHAKEITIPELRAMVALHKKPIDINKVVDGVRDEAMELLTDNDQREYLNKLTDGTYKLVVLAGDFSDIEGLIEVPGGAEFAIYFGAEYQHVSFYKSGKGMLRVCSPNYPLWEETEYKKLEDIDYKNVDGYVVWQRHTQPEEIPFLSCGYDIDSDKIDHDFNPSINDQYAEIEKVRQEHITFNNIGNTLSERQSQYGSFKDVANTTQKLMDQFALGRMSYVQREALHMICSKLARIANGDPNHIDSWHDIAGYATLVVNDLES